MDQVSINSGPVEAYYRPYMVPQEKWADLISKKKSFLKTKIKSDCRYLLEFVDDAEEMWKALGYESKEDLITNGYDLDPVEVDLAIQWLKIKDSKDAVPYTLAIQYAREMPKNEKAGAPVGHKGCNEYSANDKLLTISKQDKGPTNQNHLRRIARDKPELLDEIEAGTITFAKAKELVGIKETHVVRLGKPKTVARAIFSKKGIDYVKLLLNELEEIK
jgi:hypothetical protein